MNNQSLIIYKFNSLYQILKELEHDLNFEIVEATNDKLLNIQIKNFKNYLIITREKILNNSNQYIFCNPPIKIFKLIEMLNIKFIKKNFNEQSEVNIKSYIINLNSREMLFESIKLKLTEKEINIIVYLSKIKKSVSINELQTNVWGYQSELETHTVETHIYRLRKKIFKIFNDKKFIISNKDGYKIN